MTDGGGQQLVGVKIPELAFKHLFHYIVFENIWKPLNLNSTVVSISLTVMP